MGSWFSVLNWVGFPLVIAIPSVSFFACGLNLAPAAYYNKKVSLFLEVPLYLNFQRCPYDNCKHRSHRPPHAPTEQEMTAQSGGLGVPFRLPLLILGFVSLASGVLAGLARFGWGVPLPSAQLALLHGPLMVCGFLGTVIGLERAVALGRRWAYAGPLLTGLGGIAILAGFPVALGASAMALGSAVLLTGTMLITLRQRELFMVTMALGAASWLAGNLLWLAGAAVPAVVALWVNFLVLTIAGERLELSRFLPPSPGTKNIFKAILAVLVAGALLNVAGSGIVIYGIGLLGLALWLLRQDIARRTVKEQGLTRFIAVCLLSGYAWLPLP